MALAGAFTAFILYMRPVLKVCLPLLHVLLSSAKQSYARTYTAAASVTVTYLVLLRACVRTCKHGENTVCGLLKELLHLCTQKNHPEIENTDGKHASSPLGM